MIKYVTDAKGKVSRLPRFGKDGNTSLQSRLSLMKGGTFMAKGSVRKKGKKWYYRFYVDDAHGNPVQKEFPKTESKSETESMLRKAMDEHESKKFVAKASNITVGEMPDMWVRSQR